MFGSMGEIFFVPKKVRKKVKQGSFVSDTNVHGFVEVVETAITKTVFLFSLTVQSRSITLTGGDK